MNYSKEIIEKLKAGNQRYIADNLAKPNQDIQRKEMIVSGQDPFAIILSCSDSRVVPEIIFDTGLGDLFVVRVAGNIANISSIASIEYAITHLKASVIMVLAHENCGTVTTALKGRKHDHNLTHLLSHLSPAISVCESNEVDEVSKKNALLTAKELIKKSSIIRNAVESGSHQIVTAFYHLESGKVDFI